jgi:hypothetical protein
VGERDPDSTLGSLIPLRGPSSLRGAHLRVVRVFGVADLAFDLGTGACAHKRARDRLLTVVLINAQIAALSLARGCYDCGVFDTPSLVFHNTSGGVFTNAQMVLQGYQGLNNGLTATVSLGTLGAGDTQIFWGSLPGVPSGTTPGNLTAYDYDDEYIGTSSIINDPTCGGGGCAPGGGPQWYAQVGNFSVTFTATISGGPFNGQPVFSVFSPDSNATGGFVGWEGLDPNGFSEQTAYDVHGGSISARLPTSTLAFLLLVFPVPSLAQAFPG